MRLLALSFAALLSTLIFADAEEYATTDAGRRVVLRDNGTWVEVPAPRSSSGAPSPGNNVDQIIRRKCQNEWPTDFSMQAYCERKQREGVQTLAQGRPQDIQENQFAIIRQKCNGEWPEDFGMRAYCERKQYEAIRQLRR
jgi:hypothetical protein